MIRWVANLANLNFLQFFKVAIGPLQIWSVCLFFNWIKREAQGSASPTLRQKSKDNLYQPLVKWKKNVEQISVLFFHFQSRSVWPALVYRHPSTSDVQKTKLNKLPLWWTRAKLKYCGTCPFYI